MKKKYLTIIMVILITVIQAQNAEFYETFEGTTPLSNLPIGLTHVEPTGNINVFVNTNHYLVEAAGGAIVQQSAAAVESRAQFANTIVTEGTNKILQTDYTGHIIIDENAIGGGDFSIALDYQVFGSSMGSTDSGIITVVGKDSPTTWSADRVTSRNGGFATGLGLTLGGASGFQYGSVVPPYRDVVLTYTSSDELYRIYINGALLSTSSAAQSSGEWDDRKVYFGFAGRNSIGSGDSTEHLNTLTGEFTANGVRNDGRNADLQTRVDNISVFKRALSATEITALYGTDGTDGTSPLEVANVTWDGSESTDWTDGDNWSTGTVPGTTSVAVIPAGLTNYPVIATTVNISGIEIASGASLTTTGSPSITANVTYNVTVNDTNWHLLSSPVVGEGYDTAWVNDNLIDNTNRTVGTNIGIATYINTTDANGDWTYAEDDDTANFETGKGYSMKRDATGSDISFTGTIKIDNLTSSIDQGFGGLNKWNLMGNPYPSYILVSDLITDNAANLTDTHEMVYVYDNNKSGGAGYSPLAGTDYIHPGQAFFLNADNSAASNFTIDATKLSSQTGVTLYRSSSETSINLMINDGNVSKSTEINYLADKATALDPSFDLGTFTGESTDFNIFTHLVSDSEGVDFTRQALPNSGLESMVIPVGIKAEAGTAITFSAETLNLPSGIQVYLEDREENVFTLLDTKTANYIITLSENVNGVGRFYVHTKTSLKALNTSNTTLNNLSIYKSDASTLRIVGLPQGNVNTKIYNILGKQVKHITFDTNGVQDISLPKLASGIYVVQLETATSKLSKKIILE